MEQMSFDQLRRERLASAGNMYLARRSAFEQSVPPIGVDLSPPARRSELSTPWTPSAVSEYYLYSLRTALDPSSWAPLAQTSHSLLEGDALDLEAASVTVDEVLTACAHSTLTDDAKLRFVFDLFDVHRREYLTRDDVAAFLAATMATHQVALCGVTLTDITDRMFTTDRLDFSAFRAMFHTAITVAASPPPPPPKDSGTWVFRWLDWAVDYFPEVQFVTGYVSLNLIACTIKVTTIPWDPVAGHLPQLAKGMAQIVLLNAACVLLPMCRSIVTALRNVRWLWAVIPFDHTIAFHKLSAIVLLLASVVHSGVWIAIIYLVRTAPEDAWDRSLLSASKTKLLRYGAYLDVAATLPVWTGIGMLVCAGIALPCTHHHIRRAHFNLFWITHCLFAPFIVFLLIHGAAAWIAPPQTQYWIGGPLMVYLIERRYRVSRVFGGATRILKVHVASDMVAIYLKKPRGFHNFQPGMYLFLKVPVLSKFEWHPFTISSCPEDDYLSVHIRRAGDWTNALHDVLRHTVQMHRPMFPAVAIDGPIGAPSQDYNNYPAVVLIGAGIGVTPFASILKHLVHVWEEHRCHSCCSIQLPHRILLRKVYFYWVTREQESLSWFRDTMQELSLLDTDGRLEIQTYLTPLSRESVVAPMQMLQTFMQQEEGHDVWTGIASKNKNVTHFGRPDWAKELARIGQHHPGDDIGVFLCGPQALSRTVQNTCHAFNRVQTDGTAYAYHSEKF